MKGESTEKFSKTPNKQFKLWMSVADLIARLAGDNCEVVLHDLDDPMHSVIYVVNGHVTNRAVGQGFRHLVVEILRSEAQNLDKNLLDDWWFEYENKLIRSMTLLIRNQKGMLIGALCVNQDVTFADKAFEIIKFLLPGLTGTRMNMSSTDRSLSDATIQVQKDIEPKESVLDTVFHLIDSIVRQARPHGETLTKLQRLKVLDYMDSREIFSVKGSIERTAQALGISKVTVYSDLDALHRQKDKSFR